jgi:hypothetical protein
MKERLPHALSWLAFLHVILIAFAVAEPEQPEGERSERPKPPAGSVFDAMSDIEAIYIDCSVYTEDEYRGFAVSVPDIASAGQVCQGIYDEVLSLQKEGRISSDAPISMVLFALDQPYIKRIEKKGRLSEEDFDKSVARNYESGLHWAPSQALWPYLSILPIDATPVESEQLLKEIRAKKITKLMFIPYRDARYGDDQPHLITSGILLTDPSTNQSLCAPAVRGTGSITKSNVSDLIREIGEGEFHPEPWTLDRHAGIRLYARSCYPRGITYYEGS